MNEHNHDLILSKRKKSDSAGDANVEPGEDIENPTDSASVRKYRRVERKPKDESSSSSSDPTVLPITAEVKEKRSKGSHKKRFNTLLVLCKEWCELHSQTLESFEQARTFITNDLSLTYQQNANIPTDVDGGESLPREVTTLAEQTVSFNSQPLTEVAIDTPEVNSHQIVAPVSLSSFASSVGNVPAAVDSISEPVYVEPVKGKKRKYNKAKDDSAHQTAALEETNVIIIPEPSSSSSVVIPEAVNAESGVTLPKRKKAKNV